MSDDGESARGRRLRYPSTLRDRGYGFREQVLDLAGFTPSEEALRWDRLRVWDRKAWHSEAEQAQHDQDMRVATEGLEADTLRRERAAEDRLERQIDEDVERGVLPGGGR